MNRKNEKGFTLVLALGLLLVMSIMGGAFIVLNLNKSGSLFLAAILCWAVLTDTALSQTSGHRVSNNQVIISGRNHWQNWLFPSNTLLISDINLLSLPD